MEYVCFTYAAFKGVNVIKTKGINRPIVSGTAECLEMIFLFITARQKI